MARLLISLAGTLLKEIELTKPRISLGRRPHNDIVLDNLAISGEHLALVLEQGHYVAEDMGSTNGTRLNGQPLKRATLKSGDVLELGKYRMVLQGEPPSGAEQVLTASLPPEAAAPSGYLVIQSGSSAGKRMRLDKPVTTLGRTGVQIIAITRQQQSYSARLVEGSGAMLINNEEVGPAARDLKHGDLLEVMGTRIRFELA